MGSYDKRRAADARLRMLQENPSKYTRSDQQQRFVFMDMDNITLSFSMGDHLYQQIPGATSMRDLRLNFKTLTERVYGGKPQLVKRQLSAYFKTSEVLAQVFKHHRWTVAKQENSSDTFLHFELYTQLFSSTGDSKTLVLVTGDANRDTDKYSSFVGIVRQFLEKSWNVEIHSWLYSLSEAYVELQKNYPKSFKVYPLDTDFHELVTLAASTSSSSKFENNVPPYLQQRRPSGNGELPPPPVAPLDNNNGSNADDMRQIVQVFTAQLASLQSTNAELVNKNWSLEAANAELLRKNHALEQCLGAFRSSTSLLLNNSYIALLHRDLANLARVFDDDQENRSASSRPQANNM